MNETAQLSLWVISSISAYAAFNHLLIGMRRPFNRLHLLFAGICFSIPLLAISNYYAYQASSIPDYVDMLRLNLCGFFVFLLLFPWFIAEYTGVRPVPLLATFNLLTAVLFLANLLLPYTLQYEEILSLYRLRLPWGEEVTRVMGINGGWFTVGALTLLSVEAYSLYSLNVLYRRGRKLSALIMLFAMVLFVPGTVAGILTRMSVFEFIELGGYAYVAMVAVMNMVLGYESWQSSKDLEAILEYMPEAFYMKDADGRYLMVNHHSEEIFNLDRKAIIGKTDYDFLPESQADVLRANDRKVLATGRGLESEETADLNGEPRTYHSFKFPLVDFNGVPSSVCGISTDITERKRTEDALAKSELKHRMLFAHANDAICLMQGDRFIDCNDKALAMFGCNRPDIIGNTPLAFSPPQQHDGQDSSLKAAGKIQAAYRGEGQVFEWQHIRLDGQPFDVEVSLNSFEMQGDRFLLAIVRDITDRKRAEAQINFLAYYDPLTGLPNRQLTQDHFKMSVSFAERANAGLALVLLDIDNFKSINDSLGHSIGDALLKVAARRLEGCVSDADTLCRLGGDEFLVLLADAHEPEAITHTVEKFLKRFSASFEIESQHLHASVSIGIAIYPNDGKDFDTLLKRADTAMYQAKNSGKNTYRFYTEQMNANALENLHMRNGLQKALERSEFVLHYQPQIDLVTGAVTGAEALIRWNHPEFGIVPPGRFIPIAEESGLIVPIGNWVLLEACRQAVAWRKTGLPEMVVAVNISAVQFQQHDLEKYVIQTLVDSGLDPASLELELTESILIHNAETALASLQRLKSIGVKLSIDDFGTGYSSLSYLKRFNVDKLKIDQSFIRSMADDPDDAAIVNAIIQMARALKLKTIAEGVENDRLRNLLCLQHCDEAQGYHFARPMPTDDFVQYVTSLARTKFS